MISTPLMLENPVKSPMVPAELGLNLDLLVSLNIVKGCPVKEDSDKSKGGLWDLIVK